MLVLTRTAEQEIYVTYPGCTKPMRIVICSVDRGKVRIGIDAGQEADIVRGEIRDTEGQHDAE